jgi:spermidine synthase
MGVRGFSRHGLLLVALYMGFASTIVQVLLLREILTLCRGNELIIGMIFSSWFLGVYCGARHRLSPVTRNPEPRVLLSVALIPALAALSVYMSHLVQVFFPHAAGSFYSIPTELALAFLFTLPVGFFVGLFFPALVSLVSDGAGERSGGLVFYLESLGSFAGGIVFSFLLVDRANPLAIASILLSIALAAILALVRRRLLFLAAVPLLVALFSGVIEKKIFAFVWDRTHTGRLVQYQRTKYETVAIESSGESVSVYGDGVLVYTIPDRYEARGIFHLVQSLRQERGNILLLGSGPGSLLHNLLRADIKRLYYFEPDPALWHILRPFADAYYGPLDETRLSVPGVDLRHYFKESGSTFDMIVSIPPPPDNIMLNRFYTREFFSMCRRHLTGRGIFMTSLHGFSNYMSKDLRNYVASIYAAFTGEFPFHMKTSGQTIYLIGALHRGVLPGSVEALMSSYGQSGSPNKGGFEREITENYSPDELRMFFERTQLEYFDRTIAPLARPNVSNSDLKPGAYWKNIIFTAFREQSSLHALLRDFVFFPVLMLILTGAAFWEIRRKNGSRAVLNGFFMYITGVVSISTMVLLILIYQNSHGIVYHRISAISALYMLGLALGCLAFNQMRYPGLPLVFMGIAGVLALILAGASAWAGLLYWMLIPTFSFLCGAVFPLLFTGGGGSEFDGPSWGYNRIPHDRGHRTSPARCAGSARFEYHSEHFSRHGCDVRIQMSIYVDFIND